MSRLLLFSSLMGVSMSASCNYGISFADSLPAPFRDGDCQSTDQSAIGIMTSTMFSCDDGMFYGWNDSASCEGDADYSYAADASVCDGENNCDQVTAELTFTGGDSCNTAAAFGTGTYVLPGGYYCFDARLAGELGGYIGYNVNASGMTITSWFDQDCTSTFFLFVDSYGEGSCIPDNETMTSTLAQFNFTQYDDHACRLNSPLNFIIAFVFAAILTMLA